MLNALTIVLNVLTTTTTTTTTTIFFFLVGRILLGLIERRLSHDYSLRYRLATVIECDFLDLVITGAVVIVLGAIRLAVA